MPAGKNSQSPQSARGGTQSQEGFQSEAPHTNMRSSDDTESARAIDRELSDSASPDQGVDGRKLK
jgi:hypothetical protein